jgi:hypothetical protein
VVSQDLYKNIYYISTSKAEWSIAKNGYVAARSGWFSCRSACYLAAGRPVVVQETGFSDVLPHGEGIIPFGNIDEAVSGIDSVTRDWSTHSRAASAIAEDWFDSDKVLPRLIEQAIDDHSR